MRVIAVAVLLVMVSACGGGSSEPQPYSSAEPAVVTTADIVFIGDSITASMPVRKYIPSSQNVGVSGEQTDQMLARFDTDVLARKPRIVVILGGTNDIRNLARVDTTNLFAMVGKAMAANARVIVGTLPPSENVGSDPDLKHQLWTQFNKEVKDGAASLGYDVADYYQVMITPDGRLDARLFLDYLHPNEFGYNAMWTVLRPLIEKDIR